MGFQKKDKNRKPWLARPNYYQGILQLRDVNPKVLEFVHAQLEKREDVVITRTVKHSNGVDLYITSHSFLKSLGKKLRESFGGELKTSAKLHTRNKQGKDLFRVNVLYRPSKYRHGDIVNIRGDDIRLISIGSKIFGKEVKTGRRVTIRSSDLPRD